MKLISRIPNTKYGGSFIQSEELKFPFNEISSSRERSIQHKGENM